MAEPGLPEHRSFLQGRIILHIPSLRGHLKSRETGKQFLAPILEIQKF